MTRNLLIALAISMTSLTPLAAQNSTAIALDGDTFRHEGETIRLLGLDAPEMGGKCRVGRTCVAGDPVASRDSLQSVLNRGNLKILRVSKDRYGRTVAAVRARRIEVSCYQIRNQRAKYVRRWDNYRIVGQRCPSVARTIYRPVIVTEGERG